MQLLARTSLGLGAYSILGLTMCLCEGYTGLTLSSSVGLRMKLSIAPDTIPLTTNERNPKLPSGSWLASLFFMP